MTTDTRWATATLPGRAGAQCGRGVTARSAPDAPIPQTAGGVPEGNRSAKRSFPESLRYPCPPNVPDRLMNRRSRAREVALQMLFWRDHNPAADRSAVERFARERLRDPDLVAFCLDLYDGVTTQAVPIDARLTEAAENWRLARMAAVDRN